MINNPELRLFFLLNSIFFADNIFLYFILKISVNAHGGTLLKNLYAKISLIETWVCSIFSAFHQVR